MSELDYGRPVEGSGQTLAMATASTAETFATGVPANGVSLVAITFSATAAPAAPAQLFIRISKSLTAAAHADYPVVIPTSGQCPTVTLRCAPGDNISLFASVAGTGYCCWMTS